MSVRANFRIHTEGSANSGSKGGIVRKKEGRHALSRVEAPRSNAKDFGGAGPMLQKMELGSKQAAPLKTVKKAGEAPSRGSSRQKAPHQRTAVPLTPNLPLGHAEPRYCGGYPDGFDECISLEADIPDRGISMIMEIPELAFMGFEEPVDFGAPSPVPESEYDDLASASCQSYFNMF